MHITDLSGVASVQHVQQEPLAKVIVTGRNALERRRTRQALRRAIPGIPSLCECGE